MLLKDKVSFTLVEVWYNFSPEWALVIRKKTGRFEMGWYAILPIIAESFNRTQLLLTLYFIE